MKKIDQLSELARSKGLDVMEIKFIGLLSLQIVYHSYKQAGKIPNEEYCRDHKDYELRMAAWYKAGTVYSPKYFTFDEMLAGELKRLKNVG